MIGAMILMFLLRQLWYPDETLRSWKYCSELHSHSRGLGLWQRNAQATEISTHRNIQHTLTQDPDSTLRLLCFSTDTRKGHFPWHIPQPSLGSQMRHHPLSHPSGRKFTLSHPHTENNHPSHTFPGHVNLWRIRLPPDPFLSWLLISPSDEDEDPSPPSPSWI